MEKFEKLDNEQKELVKYWIEKYKKNVFEFKHHDSFIEKYLTPEPFIEVGVWVKAKNPNSRFLVYIESLEESDEDGNSVKSYGFSKYGDWMKSELRCPIFIRLHCIKATPEEVKQRLIEEAKRRGFVKGVKFHPIFNEKEKTRSEVCICNGEFFSNTPNRLSASISGCFGQLIMNNGKWADIIDEKAELKEEFILISEHLTIIKQKLGL